MKQIIILEQLKERILEDGIIQYSYIKQDENTGECKYCAVGHLLNICGVEPVRLNSLGNIIIGKVYSNCDFVKAHIDESGLDIDFIWKLQRINDSKKVIDLIKYIDEKILELKENV